MRKKFLLLSTMLIAASILLAGCSKDKKSEEQAGQVQIIEAKMQTTSTDLYFSGMLQPIQVEGVASPVDGNVHKIFFRYGQLVKKGQLLFDIDSPQMLKTFREAVGTYLKSLDTYERSVQSYNGTKELYDAKIVDKQTYLGEKSTVENNQLALFNAKYALEQAVENMPGVDKELKNLSLGKIEQVKKVLQEQFDEIEIHSKFSGVALFPQQGAGSDSAGKQLQIGSAVKKGQSLLTIGDLSGVSTTVQASEVVVNRIKPGQKVTLTSSAFPSITLDGEVKSVGAQAKSSGGGGGLATFPVVIDVPKLTQEAKQIIRVGMNAKVKLSIKNPAHIVLPINAVIREQGRSMVIIKDPKTDKEKKVPVVTGPTTLTGVTIISGIKAGDKIVIRH